MATAVGSGSGDDLSGRIDVGRVDGLSAEVTISGGGSVRGGGSRGKVTRVMEPIGETIAFREIGLPGGSSGSEKRSSSSELDEKSSSELVGA